MSKPPMKGAIRSEADLRKAIETISLDLGHALDTFTLFMNLMEAQQGKYWKAVSQAQTFWSLTYGALLDSTLFRLCRAYDQDPDALTLRTILQIIQLNSQCLPRTMEPIDETQLTLDLDSVSAKTSKTVNHLMMWRHKLFAHRDPKKVVRETTLGSDYPLTYDDVGALLDNGFKILNRYGIALFRQFGSQKIVGADDYLEVLKTLQRSAERR